MTHDPLDDWLHDPKPRLETQQPDSNTYVAFRPLDRRQYRVRICPFGQPWEWLPYAYLQRIVTEGDTGRKVALIWAFAVVIIEGRNLQALDYALAHEAIDFIRAFDPDRFPLPTDKKAPFIEKITIHVQEAVPPAVASAEPATIGGRRH